MTDRIKCTRCKVNLTFDKFKKKRDDVYTKTCIECLEKNRIYAKNNRCIHDREKKSCKECKGSQICEHDKRKSHCRECKGGSVCEHDKIRSQCKKCKGGSICEHNKEKSTCRECKGSQICEHDKRKSHCRECKGGSICEHDKIRSQCKKCKGGSVCEHDKIRYTCKECNLGGYISGVVRGHIKSALKRDKELHSEEYLCCDIKTFKTHIENQFEKGMTWENHGKWHIDHITPLKYKEDGNEPTLEEVIERLHYTNTQPLWAEENISKGNRFIG